MSEQPRPSQSKCNTKNPCKVCLYEVKCTNGIQCTGKCRSFVHYDCLDATPGKISDIKNGFITVTCPCPDCTSQKPKEFLTDKAKALRINCSNTGCLANQRRRQEKPSNKDGITWPLQPCSKSICKKSSDVKLASRKKCSTGCSPTSSTVKEVCSKACSPNQSMFKKSGGCKTPEEQLDQLCRTISTLQEQMNGLVQRMNDGLPRPYPKAFDQPMDDKPGFDDNECDDSKPSCCCCKKMRF